MGLTWAPPTGYAGFTSYTIAADGTGSLSTTSAGVVTHTLSDSVDYKISAPATITSPIIIKGGRNVVWIAGRITLGYQGAFASGQRRRALHVGNGAAPVADRIVHLEGLLLDGSDLADALNVDCPGSYVQVENCRHGDSTTGYHFRSCDDRDLVLQYATKGTHPDGIQPWGGCKELRIDGLTCKSAYQGLFLNTIDLANAGIARIRRYNWEALGFTSTEEGPVTGGVYTTNVVRHAFESTTESWSFANSGTQSLAQSTAQAQAGAGSLAATRTFATTFDQVWVWSAAGENIGSDTALKAYVLVPTGSLGSWTARVGFTLPGEAAGSARWSSTVSATVGTWTQVICDVGALGYDSADVDRIHVQIQRGSGQAAGSVTVYTDTVSSGTISGYVYGGPTNLTYYGQRAINLGDANWGNVYLDEGTVYTKHHVNAGWAATSNTNPTARPGSGAYYTRYYYPGHAQADANGYVLDPPPGTARFQDTLYPPPDVVTATYATWTTQPRIRNWDGTGDGRVYSGAAAGGDYVPAATVGTSYVSPGYGAETPGSAVVYSADPLSGTANSPTLPAGWTGSGSTGWVTKMNSDGVGIVMQSGVLGVFNDYVRLDLAAAGTTAMTDYEIFAWWYWNNPLVSETVAFYIRSSDDWANSNNPATWVRTQINNTGAADIRHRLSSGTQNLDASATVTVTNGVSQKVRLRVVGNNIYARYWDNNLPEPSGWTMGPVAMTTDIVSGPGRSKAVLIGGSAASSVSARLRSFIVTDLTADVPTPPAPTFIPSAGRLSVQRGRRRR